MGLWAVDLQRVLAEQPQSQAPFHPTPAGQASIANYVIPTLLKLFGGPLPTGPASAPAPSTTSSAPSSTTTSSSTPASSTTPTTS